MSERLDFIGPAIAGIDPKNESLFKLMKFQAPVPAVGGCIDTEAA